MSLCQDCVKRKQEIAELESRLAMLCRYVAECESVQQQDAEVSR